MYGIADEFVAYCFDSAVTTWGTTVERAVREKAESAKTRVAAQRAAQSEMDKWLWADKPQKQPGRFRDPMTQL